MKEININIEGYNVNGICVGCLNYNRKMFYHQDIHDCFKNLAGIDVPDGLCIQLCWECLAAVRRARRFRDQILDAYEVLMDYSSKHTFLNSPTDLSQFAVQRVTLSAPLTLTVGEIAVEPMLADDKIDVDIDIKTELEPKMDLEFDLEQLESLDTKLETDYNDDTAADFHSELAVDPEPSSDEDIQLALLKKKKQKDKRGRRSKKDRKNGKSKSADEDVKEESVKGTRKLKNLPEDMVTLYTMTEEEMWQVRSQDLASKEFESLKYKCSDCIIGFNTRKLMDDHMNGKHTPKGPDCQQCDVCRVYLLTRDALPAHRARHLRAFRCSHCARRTTLKARMVAHVATHGGGQHRCSTCGEHFR